MFTFPVGFFGGVQTIDPFWGNVVLYLPFTGTNGQTTFTDVSQYGHAVTRNGDTVISTAQFPSLAGVNSSAYFDGNGDWLRLPNISTLNIGSGDFTLEFFCYFLSMPSVIECLVSAWGQSAGADIFILSGGSDGKISFYWSSFSVLTFFLQSSSVVTLNAWNYVAITRSGNTFSLKVNTDSLVTGTSSSSANSFNFDIGRYGDGFTGASPTSYPNAYISHLRVTKGVSRDVSTVPTAPFPIG